MLSKLTLIGNLGRDPETRTSSGGMQLTKFSVATKGKAKDAETNWWNVTCFRQSADFAAKYLKKGDMVYIEGDASIREYTDREGKPGKSIDVAANVVKSLGRRERAESAERPERLPYKDDDGTSSSIPF